MPSSCKRIGIALPRSELLESFPLLAREIPAAGQPLWRVLSRLDGGFEEYGGWFTCPTLGEARAATRAMATERADVHGVVPLSDLGTLGRLPEWLADCGLVIHEGCVFTKTGGPATGPRRSCQPAAPLVGTPGDAEIIEPVATSSQSHTIGDAIM